MVKIALDNGNHTEDQILKSIVKSKKSVKLLQTKRKKPDSAESNMKGNEQKINLYWIE